MDKPGTQDVEAMLPNGEPETKKWKLSTSDSAETLVNSNVDEQMEKANKPSVADDKYGSTVQVLAGPERVLFHVHKTLLIEVSWYFRTAFTGSFAESRNQELELASEYPSIFRDFLAWLYFQNFSLLMKKKTFRTGYMSLWVFGDAYLVPRLQNQITEYLAKRVDDNRAPFSAANVIYVYGNTARGAKLRQIIADSCANAVIAKDWLNFMMQDKVNFNELPYDFLADLTRRIVKGHEIKIEAHRYKVQETLSDAARKLEGQTS